MRIKSILLLVFALAIFNNDIEACTIVAVSGRATVDGRPLLMKNRDSSVWDIKIKIGGGGDKYVYLCQCNTLNGSLWSGYNERGFAIINSVSYNMPNTGGGNAYIMQLALEKCVTVDDFENLLDSLQKPISIRSNYGVMDALGNVAIIETNAYSHVRYNADETDCGYLIRSNYSFSQDTTGVSALTPTSVPRFHISSTYIGDIFVNYGAIAKEDLFELSQCLINSEGADMRDYAPFDENSPTPVDFINYVPRYKTTSAMVIQGVIPGESPQHTVAWTMLGPPLVTVTIPFLITRSRSLPQKAKVGDNGRSWHCYIGNQLKDSIFLNNTTINLAKLYNMSSTGIMQKVRKIEKEVLRNGNELVDEMRVSGMSDNDAAIYYAWVDYYLEEQYSLYFPDTTNTIINDDDE